MENADGRIRVACYQPLDGRTVSLIIGASCLPAPDGTVCMRPNNWEYLGDNACGNGQIYAAIDGRSYMSLWKHGLGVTTEQGLDPEWHHVRDLTPLSAGASGFVGGFLIPARDRLLQHLLYEKVTR